METREAQIARSRYHLWLALVSLALGGMLLLAYVVRSAYLDVWGDAQGVAYSQSELLEARLDSTLRRVDATLDDLVVRLPRDMMEEGKSAEFAESVERDLQSHMRVFPEISGLRVINASGQVMYLSGGGEYVNLADRLYFQQLRDSPDRRLVFSQVVQSRINGRDTLVAARALLANDGQFLGVVSAAIDLGYFESIFKSARIGTNGALAVRRADTHSLVMRQPAVPSELNHPLEPDHPVVHRLALGQNQGVLEFKAQVDGVLRLYSYRRLENYPFYVIVGLAEQDIMAFWRERAAFIAVVGITLLVCLIFVLRRMFLAEQREQAAAARLRQHGDQLNVAQRIARLGSWEIDSATGQVSCSEELFRIFEIEPEKGRDFESFFVRVHPDDQASVRKNLDEVVHTHETMTLKHRLLMPDGREKYVLETSIAERDDAGKPLRIIGTTQDITSQQAMEAQLQLLASAVQYSGEAILITDAENKIITVNPAFTRLTGYGAEEAIGRNPRFLSAGRTTAEEYQWMWRDILERGFWQGEIWDRRKDGGVYPKWMSISVIRNDDGKVRYHVAHFTDITSERAAEERLHHIAHHDVLTGLLNRFGLKGRLDQALAAARRNGSRVAVMFIDLDRFKVINDTLGHHMGDELLVEVAGRLRDAVRDSDVVARLGGDEFVIMLSGMEHSSAVATVAEKLVFGVARPYVIGGYDVYTSPSIGIAMFPTDGDDGETLMKNADAAMYHAKAAGRNNFQFFDPKMNDVAVERLKTEHAMRLALEREEFCLHFQPVINLATGRVHGVEALVRWLHPEKGLVGPNTFIGIAEETGLIQPLGEWVLWAACRQLAAFADAGLKGIRMGINISAIQMRNGNLPLLARGVIEAYDFEPSELVFEITESVAMEQPAETVRVLDLLHDMGVTIAIDDFGTGYSSLSYLRMFPIDHLKLDRSFVEEIGVDSDDSAICDATIALAHNLGLKVVAEGVETQAQLEYLYERGCDYVQGYLYSKPLPAEEITEFIRRHNVG